MTLHAHTNQPAASGAASSAQFVADNDVDDLYENAPCGYVSATPDGEITRVNATFAAMLGYHPRALVGMAFTELLTVGGRIHYETHFAPMLLLHGQLDGITVDLVAADGIRHPAFITANVRTDGDGQPTLLRIITQHARDRRAYERELLDSRNRAELERARAQELATTLQRSLIPPSLSPPPGLEAAAYYHAASVDEVSGDFYDLFPLTRDKWGFFLGDVCGKGADAAALTSLVRYTLRAAAVYDDDPVAVLHNLNTVLNHEYHGDDPRFCTVIFGVLTLGRGEGGVDVALASGGHPPAMLLSSDGPVRYLDTDGGQLVGVLAEPRFVCTRFHMAAGDTLALYTDGWTEARAGVERYDDHGALLEFAAEHSPTTAHALIAATRILLDGFGADLQDDTAVLALGVPSHPDDAGETSVRRGGRGLDGQLD